ncbi:MAG: LptF/LptG family permease [Endomicrobiales bacterium]|nr:LptF/LptG family permease [Endomicrobiales bacterium]
MKTIHRYILREFAETFIFGLAVFSIILLLDQIFQLIDLFLSKGVHILTITKLFVLILPNIFSLTIPMATLLGILLAYGRLSEDNEVTALRSSGVTFFTMTYPILVTMLVLSMFLVYFNHYISPTTHGRFRKLYQEVLSQRPVLKFGEKAISNIGEYRLYVNKLDRDSNSLQGVNIYKFSQGGDDPYWRISASSSVVSVTKNAVIFNLFNGYWQKPNPSRPGNLVHMNYDYYQFIIPFEGDVMPVSQSLKEMPATELLREIRNYKKKNLSTNFLETEYWLRWILALAPFVFGLIGIPLGIITERGSKSIGFGLSMVIIFLYYFLLVAALNLSEKGLASPALVMWLPDFALAAGALFFWRKMLKS